MTLSGEGWRVSFGAFMMTFMLCTMLLSLYVSYTRSHISPLSVRSQMICHMIALSTIPMLFTPMIDVIGEHNIPCNAYFWIMSTCFGTTVGAAMLGFWRVVRMYGYEELKKLYKFGKIKLSHEQLLILKNYVRWHSDKYLLLAQIIHMCILCMIYLPIFITDKYYNSGNYGCHIQAPPCM